MRSVRQFNAALQELQNQDPRETDASLRQYYHEEVFRAAHSFLTHVSNVSRLLWPPRKRAEGRGSKLRKELDLPDDHLLKHRTLRDHLEHYDERIDSWIESSPHHNYVDLYIGPRGGIVGDVTEGDIMRQFDPGTKKFIFRGEQFDLQAIATALGEVAQVANAAKNRLHEERYGRPFR